MLLQCEREVDLGPLAVDLRAVDVGGPKGALFAVEDDAHTA